MTALYTDLGALSRDVSHGIHDPAYAAKMFHEIPKAEVVERMPWLVERCHSKSVLHIGYESGPLHAKLGAVCTALYGVDKTPRVGQNTYQIDLDLTPDELPQIPAVDLVLIPETLEHMVAPGWLLRMVKSLYTCPVVVTVPNCFAPQPRLAQGIECINGDHKSWYSYWTIKKLLETCGYTVTEFKWYNGKPIYAEGIIMEAQ